jgi:hypothetical protein
MWGRGFSPGQRAPTLMRQAILVLFSSHPSKLFFILHPTFLISALVAPNPVQYGNTRR